MLEERASLDMMGFEAVYFFPYPEAVTIFARISSKSLGG
jgi:hypothetical protein